MISSTTGAIGREVARRQDRSRTAADSLLSLAAAPTFALMALLTGIHDGSMPAMLCSSAHDASPLTGMVAMYLLMSVFHLPPWLRLIANRCGRDR